MVPGGSVIVKSCPGMPEAGVSLFVVSDRDSANVVNVFTCSTGI